MVWIEHTRVTDSGHRPVRRLKSPETGEVAEFSPNTGRARVTAETGDDLVERYDEVVYAETGNPHEDTGGVGPDADPADLAANRGRDPDDRYRPDEADRGGSARDEAQPDE